jgi:hypothetical protein
MHREKREAQNPGLNLNFFEHHLAAGIIGWWTTRLFQFPLPAWLAEAVAVACEPATIIPHFPI